MVNKTRNTNITILKKISPFLAIFIFTTLFVINQFLTDYGIRARAADEGLSLKINNIQAPTDQSQNWKWYATIVNTKKIQGRVIFDGTLNWCRNTLQKQGQYRPLRTWLN